MTEGDALLLEVNTLFSGALDASWGEGFFDGFVKICRWFRLTNSISIYPERAVLYEYDGLFPKNFILIIKFSHLLIL
ncbi:hypothetical protein C4F51_05055 [Cellvibrio sp. KB43]|uniref:Uncharacterized protein n=1 Tax=Cellvibrio polysaccharolyticus TaxID=2082724 RepID=A0A928V3J7_9GAMM|nr:hypothetical protein [Cellvibrio polysaccharolyticus]